MFGHKPPVLPMVDVPQGAVDSSGPVCGLFWLSGTEVRGGFRDR